MSYHSGSNPENLRISNNLDGNTYFRWTNSKNEFNEIKCNSDNWFSFCSCLGFFEENSKIDTYEGFEKCGIHVKEVWYDYDNHVQLSNGMKPGNKKSIVALTINNKKIYMYESTWIALVCGIQWRNRSKKIKWFIIPLYNFADWLERLFMFR